MFEEGLPTIYASIVRNIKERVVTKTMQSNISLRTHRLNYIEELETIRTLLEKMGEESQYYKEIVESLEELYQYKNVFLYAEFMEECHERTPDMISKLMSKGFNYPSVEEFMRDQL